MEGAKDDVHSPRRIDLRYDVLLPAGTLRDDGRRQVYSVLVIAPVIRDLILFRIKVF